MKVIDDRRQKINKKRWERWRARQDKEREKSYFFCWGDWSNWSDYCEDSDDSPNHCAHAKVEATLYASTNKIKVHYSAGCCGGPECGNCIYECKVRTKICGSGYCSEEKEHTFGHFVCYASGDDWFDIKSGHENDEHYAYVDVSCFCFAASGVAHASCRVQKGT